MALYSHGYSYGSSYVAGQNVGALDSVNRLLALLPLLRQEAITRKDAATDGLVAEDDLAHADATELFAACMRGLTSTDGWLDECRADVEKVFALHWTRLQLVFWRYMLECHAVQSSGAGRGWTSLQFRQFMRDAQLPAQVMKEESVLFSGSTSVHRQHVGYHGILAITK